MSFCCCLLGGEKRREAMMMCTSFPEVSLLEDVAEYAELPSLCPTTKKYGSI